MKLVKLISTKALIIATAIMVTCSCKQSQSAGSEKRDRPKSFRKTPSSLQSAALLKALGGALFEFRREGLKTWRCSACPKPDLPSSSEGKSSDSRQGAPYFLVKSKDPNTDTLPLKSTRADVSIAGNVAEVRVTQIYKNEGKNTLEAIYTFPASTRAAVRAMRMTIGERIVDAKIKEREQARKDYETAKNLGQTTSLLEQERPNIFTMSVAGILPGDLIKVELIYNEFLIPEQNVVEFVYPTVVGPRYAAKEEAESDGEAGKEVPYQQEGENPSYSFGLEAQITFPVPVKCLGSPSHEVSAARADNNTVLVTLEEANDAGNRDFVLRYSLAGDEIESGALLYTGENESFFLLMANPPKNVENEKILPREYIFVIDVSGSMQGFPLSVSKNLMRDLLRGLRKGDYFNLLFFSGGSALLSEKSLSAKQTNIEEAWRAIESQTGMGGTELGSALQRAFSLPKAGDAARVVVVVTDGYIDADRQVVDLVRKNLDSASLFAFGIGSSVNRYVIEGMAHAGMGEPFVVLDNSEVGTHSERFRRYIESPLMSDIRVSFEGFDAYDVDPQHLPFLFSGRPVTLIGKYRGEPTGKVVLTGRTSTGEYRHELDVAKLVASQQTEALRYLWARQMIRNLSDLNSFHDEDSKKKVTQLGLDYSLLTSYTSFVAVDSLVRADDQGVFVRQPLPLPKGVPQSAVGGRGVGGGGTGEGTIGLGSLNTIGHGGGGGSGYGYGRGAGGLVAKRGGRSKIRSGATMVKGSLSKEVIRRIVHRHINEVRFCYEKQLASHSEISGQVVIKFIISASGKVQMAALASSTLGDATVENCILQAVRRWNFPQPKGGGSVIVTYPFELSLSE